MPDRQIDFRGDDRFRSVTSRLERVPDQIAEFTAALDEHHAMVPTLFTATFEPGNTTIHLPDGTEIMCPQRAQVVLGEIINGLRSALDNLVWSLAFRNCGHEVRNTQFVIASSRKAFDRQAVQRLKGLTPDQTAGIENMQPYNGHDWLGLLVDLSNIDKHRHLIELTNLSGAMIVGTDGTPADYHKYRGAYVIEETGGSGRAVFVRLAPPRWALIEKYEPVETVKTLYRAVCHTVATIEPSIDVRAT